MSTIAEVGYCESCHVKWYSSRSSNVGRADETRSSPVRAFHPLPEMRGVVLSVRPWNFLPTCLAPVFLRDSRKMHVSIAVVASQDARSRSVASLCVLLSVTRHFDHPLPQGKCVLIIPYHVRSKKRDRRNGTCLHVDWSAPRRCSRAQPTSEVCARGWHQRHGGRIPAQCHLVCFERALSQGNSVRFLQELSSWISTHSSEVLTHSETLDKECCGLISHSVLQGHPAWAHSQKERRQHRSFGGRSKLTVLCHARSTSGRVRWLLETEPCVKLTPAGEHGPKVEI
jgi:hypothetical protein